MFLGGRPLLILLDEVVVMVLHRRNPAGCDADCAECSRCGVVVVLSCINSDRCRNDNCSH